MPRQPLVARKLALASKSNAKMQVCLHALFAHKIGLHLVCEMS
jgi:hypothetical protein